MQDESTALMICVIHDNEEIARMLLDVGAARDLQDVVYDFFTFI